MALSNYIPSEVKKNSLQQTKNQRLIIYKM